MSNETENESRRIDKLEGAVEKLGADREADKEIQRKDKEIQEKNMQVLESNIKEILAENRAAFEKSLSETKIAFQEMLTAMERNSKRQMAFTATLIGVAVAALGLVAIWPGG